MAIYEERLAQAETHVMILHATSKFVMATPTSITDTHNAKFMTPGIAIETVVPMSKVVGSCVCTSRQLNSGVEPCCDSSPVCFPHTQVTLSTCPSLARALLLARVLASL